jgi:hypothetical protein
MLFSVDYPFEKMDEAVEFLDNAPISESEANIRPSEPPRVQRETLRSSLLIGACSDLNAREDYSSWLPDQASSQLPKTARRNAMLTGRAAAKKATSAVAVPRSVAGAPYRSLLTVPGHSTPRASVTRRNNFIPCSSSLSIASQTKGKTRGRV